MKFPTLAILAAPILFAGWCSAAETLRVMSFNVRMPSKGDGDNRWEFRRDILVDTIRAKAPDLFGTQELFHEQGQYIAEKAPEYAWFGVSRQGDQTDEHMGVFYKREKLNVIESGNFWLSETPDVPGSMSWNVSLPRMVTWALFELKDSPRRFYFYNTHFAHRREDSEARLKSAQLIAERLKTVPQNIPLIMTGDFNAPADSDVYAVFAAFLSDAWTTAERRTGPEDTFHGFRGQPRPGRIDWIFYRGAFRVTEAETVTHHKDGRYPSDHFPVFTVLEFTGEGGR
jgi:endonuclease/exonuclease/phosphatase family metal-dependent hydrolase